MDDCVFACVDAGAGKEAENGKVIDTWSMMSLRVLHHCPSRSRRILAVTVMTTHRLAKIRWLLMLINNDSF